MLYNMLYHACMHALSQFALLACAHLITWCSAVSLLVDAGKPESGFLSSGMELDDQILSFFTFSLRQINET